MDRNSTIQVDMTVLRKQMVGKKYRHFKGNFYIVDGIALHSETEEPYVVYHREGHDGELWIRPLNMFLSPVDRAKYPDVQQEFRFEMVYEEVRSCDN